MQGEMHDVRTSAQERLLRVTSSYSPLPNVRFHDYALFPNESEHGVQELNRDFNGCLGLTL